MRAPIVVFVMGGLLAGCGLPPPSAQQRADAAEDFPLRGPHPPALRASYPPADPSGNALRCTPNGQDTICQRDQ